MLIKKTKKLNLLSFFLTMSYCLTLSWKASRFYTIIRIMGRVFIPVYGIVNAYLTKYILDILSGSLHYENNELILVLIFIGSLSLALLSAGVQKVIQYCQTIQGEIVNKQITTQIMDKTLQADLEFFDNPEYYDKLSSATRDSSSITNIVWNVIECISSCIAFIGAFIVLCSNNIIYGFAVLLASFPSAIAGAKFTKSLYKLSIEQIKGERNKGYIQSLSSLRQYSQDIRLFGIDNFLKDRYNHLWQLLFDDRRKILKKRSILTGILEFLPEIVIMYIIIDISFHILSNQGTIGDYTLNSGLARQLYSSIFLFSNSVMMIYDNKLRINNIKTLDNIKNKVEDKGQKKLQKVETIEFCSVSFCYPGSNRKVLDNVSFKINKGEKVVIVGVNGSGKSTLIKLLLRFYNTDSGEIKINNINIQDFDLLSLRNNFSVYFQDMLNYSFTLRENIKISDLDRDDCDEEILKAINESCANEILSKAPEKLDTFLSRIFEDNGIELSGGEHQKIALARTFYRRHTALILDEPSSNLDPEAEYKLFEALRKLSIDKTTIYISHRLSNVSLADKIIVFENGQVIENGTKSELLNNPNRFAKLFKYQQDKFTGVSN